VLGKLKELLMITPPLFWAGVSVKKEIHVNFMTNLLYKRSTFKLADIMVYEWVGGKYACVAR